VTLANTQWSRTVAVFGEPIVQVGATIDFPAVGGSRLSPQKVAKRSHVGKYMVLGRIEGEKTGE
jgi:hypothetical protein